MARRPTEFHFVAWLARGIAAASIVSTFSLSARAELPPGNVVQQWNRLAEDTVVGANAFQNEGLIYMAYVSAAVYDAVAALENKYEPYGRHIAAPRGASADAAVWRLPTPRSYISFLHKRPHSLPGATRHWRSFRTGQPN